MNTTLHPLADQYLHQLERAAQRMPRADRNELLVEIRSHLDAGLPPGSTEGDVRNLLAELGPPEDIVAAAVPDRGPRRRGAREIFALLLLLTGLPPVIGWLAGVGLLLWSPLWTARQKVVGILVWPGGYVVAAGALPLLAIRRSCSVTPAGASDAAAACTTAGASAWSVVAIVLILVAPLLVAVYLYRAAGRQSDVT
ncbi:MAG: hypothetical protein QOE40_302 [Actinomycetota bacterium]|nr:hypothetical protein [Actinomycetota bacterium]